MKKTVYDFARHCMKDAEFAAGGIPTNERKWLDAVGFEYTVKDGCLASTGEDAAAFYDAIMTLRRLQEKYSKEA